MPPLGARAGLWTFVTYPDGEKGKWKCNFCGKRLAGSAGRLAAHLAKDGSDPGVAACTATVSDEAISAAQQFICEANKKRLFSKEVKARKKSKISNKLPVQLSLSDGLDPIYREDADTALMNCLCANLLPLSILENFHFKKFISLVCQNGQYSLPSRQIASCMLLDIAMTRTHKELFDLISTEQEQFGGTIASDVLAGNHEHSLANYLLATPSHEGVLKIVDCGTASRDASLLIDHLEHIMTSKIDMIVLENATTSTLSIIEMKWNWVNALSCAASSVSNIFSILTSDAAGWWASVSRRSLHVSSLFRSHYGFSSLLHANGGLMTLLPSDARLGGDLAMLWRLFTTQPALITTVTSSEFAILCEQQSSEAQNIILNPARDIILNETFWSDLHFFLEISSPIAMLLLQFDGNSPFLGDIIPSFIDTKSRIKAIADYTADPVRHHLIETLLNAVDEAWDRIRHPAYSAAYLLHPRYAGDELGQLGSSPEYEKDLLRIISQQLGGDQGEIQRAMTEYVNFRSGQGVLHEPVFRNLARGSMQEPPMPGHLWWQAVGTNWRVLRPIAMKLLSKAPSASHCSRAWSGIDPIISNKPCKYGSGTMGKMLLVNQNLNCMTNKCSLSTPMPSFTDGMHLIDVVNYVKFLRKEPVFEDEDVIQNTPEGKLLLDDDDNNIIANALSKPMD